MAKLLATTKTRPCPVCSKTNGNCRIGDNDLVLCMTYPDGYGAENHPDYRFTKPTKDGSWGIYAPRTDNDFDREKWLREVEARQVETAQRNQAALSVEVRDRDIKTILSQLSLNDGDRRALYRRGFTDGDIERLGYKSVKQWQPVEGTISYAVNRRGNLKNDADGVIIPIPYFGRYQALRLHNPQGRPKYKSFTGSHLKNGEFPIAVYGEEFAKGQTWVTEGLEFKPALTYLRLQVPVIGHNGSNFTSSKNQVREALKLLNTETVIMAPDGGVVTNPNLINQYRNAIAFYQSLGYTVKVAWWGQWTKAQGDIDEVTDISRIQYISPETFLSYCQRTDIGRFKDWLGKQIKRVKPQGFGVPKIEGETFEGARAKAWLETDGDVLDNSFCGSGKSHDVPHVENSLGKVWYVYADHRNPTIPAIADEFTDLFPRNQYGFYRDAQGKLKTAKEDTPREWIIETRGHCPRADLFPKLTDQGHDPNRGGSSNPICQSCPFSNQCRWAEGWYLHDRSEALKAPKIRCAIESMPRDWDYSKDIAILDEIARLLKAIKVINATFNQVYLDLSRLRKALTDAQFLAVESIIQTLKTQFENREKWGINCHKMQKILGAIAKPDDLDEIIEKILAAPLDLSSVFPKPDNIDLSGLTHKERKKLRQQIQDANAYANGQAYRESQENLQNIPPNALIYILKALRNDKGVALLINHGNLSITLDNRDSYAFLRRTKKNISLDATIPVSKLKMMLGGDRPITAIHSEMPNLSNLKIVQIKVKGIGSKEISDRALNRLRLICRSLGDMPTIAPKLWQEKLDIDGYWGNHNRGSNDFQGCEKMLFLHLPRPNLGMIENEYFCLHGNLDGFGEYYQSLVNQEIVQALGRPRADRYPGKKFTIYFVTPEKMPNPDDPNGEPVDCDLSWLSQYGCKVTIKSAFEIHPDAGTEAQVTLWQIIQTAYKFVAEGAAHSQTAIAQVLGMTQQNISKTLANKGLSLEWIVGKIQELIPTTGPYKDSLRPSCNTGQLYDGFRAFFDLDPIELAEDAVKTITEHGLTYFWEEYLSFMPKPIQAKYLTALLPIFWDVGPPG